MKCGLKTFPLSVDLDDSVKLVEAEFGLKGYAVVIKLYQAIYSRGYYMKWDIDTELLFIRDYCLVEVGRNLVSEIVACCVRRGVFESSLYEKYKILTSKRIQETFLTATRRSTEVLFEKEYALPIVYTFIENARKSGKNVNIFFKNADSFEQRKEKERKEKESKEKESKEKESKEKECDAHAREDTPLERFLKRWNVNSHAIGNYSGGRLAGIDWEKVSANVERSSFLKQQKAISFFIDHYADILDGRYDDFERQSDNGKRKDPDFDGSRFAGIVYE